MDILVTGATGNVGREVVRQARHAGLTPFAGTRGGRVDPPPDWPPDVPQFDVDFDADIAPARQFDAIFLLRPPKIADPDVFGRFLDRYDRDTRIVFLSVRGADRKSYLPHAKIEKRIAEMGFSHVFVRPSYFMENLLTTLWPELQDNRRIYLPAGKLRLDWISVRDVATVSVAALAGRVPAPAVEACSGRMLGFGEVCAKITEITGVEVRYQPAGVLAYVRYMRGRGADWSFIAIMLLLHAVPRLGRDTRHPHDQVDEILGHAPETLDAFLARHKEAFQSLAGAARGGPRSAQRYR